MTAGTNEVKIINKEGKVVINRYHSYTNEFQNETIPNNQNKSHNKFFEAFLSSVVMTKKREKL